MASWSLRKARERARRRTERLIDRRSNRSSEATTFRRAESQKSCLTRESQAPAAHCRCWPCRGNNSMSDKAPIKAFGWFRELRNRQSSLMDSKENRRQSTTHVSRSQQQDLQLIWILRWVRLGGETFAVQTHSLPIWIFLRSPPTPSHEFNWVTREFSWTMLKRTTKVIHPNHFKKADWCQLSLCTMTLMIQRLKHSKRITKHSPLPFIVLFDKLLRLIR